MNYLQPSEYEAYGLESYDGCGLGNGGVGDYRCTLPAS